MSGHVILSICNYNHVSYMPYLIAHRNSFTINPARNRNRICSSTDRHNMASLDTEFLVVEPMNTASAELYTSKTVKDNPRGRSRDSSFSVRKLKG
jgi:hypothetical protein